MNFLKSFLSENHFASCNNDIPFRKFQDSVAVASIEVVEMDDNEKVLEVLSFSFRHG